MGGANIGQDCIWLFRRWHHHLAGGRLAADQRASKTWSSRHFLRCAGIPIIFAGTRPLWNGAGIFEPPPDAPKSAETSSSATAMDYLKTAKMDDPRAVPTVSDEALAKFPPTLWITGTRSFDMSPVIVCHARFLKLGVDSYLYVMEGGQHGAYNIGEQMTPEGRDTVSYIARLFQQRRSQ
jgi:acetyl esterase/lipase